MTIECPNRPLHEAHAALPEVRGKIRVGLFADSPLQPRWVVEGFARVAASDYADVVALVEQCAAAAPTPWLWRAYGRVDRRAFGSQPDPCERIELQTCVPRARVLSLPDRNAGQSAIAAWRAEIAALRLDVAFALGDVDDAALDGVARHGVWRYCFGEELEALEALAGFREVTQGAPVTASGLTARLAGGAQERLLYESWSRTVPLSVARTRDNVLRKTSEFAGRALQQLHRLGDAWLEHCAPVVRVPRAAGMPGNGEIVRGLSRLGGRMALRGLQKLLYVDQWFLAYCFGNDARWQGDLRRLTRLVPPKDRYWADPFPLVLGGRHFIFFEEFMFDRRKAHISVIEVDRSGACSTPQTVLERDYHVSYPFLVEHGGQLFMVPETGDNRTVELYRCVDFPHRWRQERLLLHGERFVDATLHRADDRWWMFVNIGFEGAEYHDELHLFHADHLHGDWRPHRGNPVKSDVRSARPAGKLFHHDGALYRPAQICAPLYGSGISINRVLHLSPDAYLEQEGERILPTHSGGLLGIHTLNRAGGLTVVDGFMRRRWLGERASSAPELARPVPHRRPIRARRDGSSPLEAGVE